MTRLMAWKMAGAVLLLCAATVTVQAQVVFNNNPATLAQLYTSVGLHTTVGLAVNFPVPTISNAKVYMGTLSEVDVFGPCTASPTGSCLN
jgi:hypothetical protein